MKRTCGSAVVGLLFAAGAALAPAEVASVAAARPSAWAASAPWQLPSSSLSASRDFSILKATIKSVDPAGLSFPGQVFTVTVEVATDRPTTPSLVRRRLRVLVDGKEAAPIGSQTAPAISVPIERAASGSGTQQAAPEPGLFVLTLLSGTPEDFPGAYVIKANLAISDVQEGLVLDAGSVEVLRPVSTIDRLRDILLDRAVTLISVVLGMLALAFAFFSYRREQQRRHELQRELESASYMARTAGWSEAVPPPDMADEKLQKLVMPSGLEEELQSGEMLLFVGAHLGEAVGEPAFSEVLRRLLDASETDDEERRLVSRAIERGDLMRAADLIAKKSADGVVGRELQRIFKGVPKAQPHLYRVLSAIGFAGVLTTTWSDGVDRAFADREPEIVSPGRKTPLEFITSGRFFILHMWGQLVGDKPLLGKEQVLAAHREGSFYARFVQSLVNGRPILFIGASPADIEWVLSQVTQDGATQRHFAFVPSFMLSTQARLLAELLRERHGVQVTSYQSTQRDALLADALQELRGRLGPRPVPSAPNVPRHLTGLVLQNIGPFADLRVDFTPDWNVVLGDNACGKSTILRAIALGLCGDTPQAAEPGMTLLRAGADTGRIELIVGSESYVITLYREPDGIHLSSSGLTPLQRGGWVVLGFPPIRGVWLKQAERPSPAESRSRPMASDLLPLLAGGVDSRVDDLCQWIAGLHATSRGAALLDSFFAVLRDLTPTDELRMGKVDELGKVWVETNDGSVPIELVSQGMSSTIGWIGTLLQRMYEIYPNAEHPESQPALILVDEIDAHLHPAWQRALVGLVRKHFKGVQVIATTHSPLVVGGLVPEAVLVAARDAVDRNVVGVRRIAGHMDLSSLRADEILTSSLFGLKSTRSDKHDDRVQRFAELLGKQGRDAQEEVELASLRQSLEGVGSTKMSSGSPRSDLAASVTESKAGPPALDRASAMRALEKMSSFFGKEGRE